MSALDEFAERPVWVTWRAVLRDGEPTKVPFIVGTDHQAKANDPKTWRPRPAKIDGRDAGIGIMLGEIEGRGLGGVDLDACIGAEGDVAPWAREIVELLGSYTEVSPSGHGLHILFDYDPCELSTAQGWRKSVHRPAADGGKDEGIECYLGKRYFAVTDQVFEHYVTRQHVGIDALRVVQDRILAFRPRDEPKPKSKANGHHQAPNDEQLILEAITHMANSGLDWEQWNTLGMAIYAATGGSDQGYAAFLNWSARSSKYRRAACDERWANFHASPPDRLTAGTIFHEAKAGGWQDPRKRNGRALPPPPNDTAEPTGESEPNAWAAFVLEVERLAKLDLLSYQRERKDIAGKLKVPVRFLDKQVEAVRNPPKADGLPEVVPWPDPVDGLELLDAIKAAILRHVRVPTRAEEAMALWVLFTHCFDAMDVSPRLAITSPMPECGKTTLMELIESLVARPRPSSNISPAAVFRVIEKYQPTLMLDEVDTFLPDNEPLRGILNCGHKRRLAYVERTVGDDHDPKRFSTWCPLVVALIGTLPATLAGRSIIVELQRLRRGEKVEPFRAEKTPYGDLARKAARWALDNMDALRGVEPAMPEGFMNRRADNWRPLFAVADRAGGAWPELAREAALTLNHVAAGEDIKAMLLADIRIIIGERSFMFSKHLAEALGEMEGRPWPEYGRSKKPITVNGIARLLKPLMIFPRTFRDGDDSAKGYRAADFEEAFQRYLSPDPPC